MDQQSEGSSGSSKDVFTKKYLYDFILKCPIKQIDKKFEHLENHLHEMTKCDHKILKHKLSHFKSDFKTKWAMPYKKREVFEKNNEKWLQGIIFVPLMTSLRAGGRPQKKFSESSERTKRRKTIGLRQQMDADQLTFAAQMSLRVTGNTDASTIIKEITKSPKRALRFRRNIAKAQDTPLQLSPTEALSMFVEGDFTRNQYNIIRKAAEHRFPCYSIIQKAKRLCYPKPEAFRVTSTCAEVKLQDVLDHTCTRLCIYLREIIEKCANNEKYNFELICKWGCDGSQQSRFKQKFENSTYSDANIFQSSFVPLRLQINIDKDNKLLWQNPLPSSPRYCRPIRIRFIQESKDVTKDEIQYVNSQLKHLRKTKVLLDNGDHCEVKHTLLFTMVDGKICNAATDTLSTMRCYLCGVTSKDFNNLSKKGDVNTEALQFGISVLHAKIRLFESILHLAYKIPTMKWQARNLADKKVVDETKKIIQARFREEMGLLVDIPKAGFGNTNDGNTARRFFQDPKLASRITGVDETLIYRFKIILEAISSGHEIDTTKFDVYAMETAKLYVSLYNWHPMTPTVHKILIHGAAIISHAMLPIGQLSEEAAEARNKHFRTYRQGFARKFSRESCNRDILNRLLLSSDPLISSTRPLPRKKTKQFSSDTIKLFLPSSITLSSELNLNTDEEELSEDSDDFEY